ncbi:MAG: DUF512 domain-containing protein [Clostridiales bacterium]|nr:DUF512 domain-containing protein [Clostridiales bacterium]
MLKAKAHTIARVTWDSIAHEAGIQPGDRLIAIDDTEVVDVLDYLELLEKNYLELTVKKANGEEWILEIEKEPGEDLGIDFEVPLLDRKKECANNCIFCFVDQLPPASRDSLRFKDDDWRLSFLMGNYITLTNLSPRDIRRIHEKRISPLYISIHTTDPRIRKTMMGNKRAEEILDILRGFRNHGIQIHCQIVLVRGLNDEKNLDKTLTDLWGFRDIIQSIAVVPVGLTGHREGLFNILPYDKGSSVSVIEQIEKWQNFFKEMADSALVFAADEFYIMADRPMPEYAAYEDFPQIENGVGLVRKFKSEFMEAIEELEGRVRRKGSLSIATGISAGGFFSGIGQILEETIGITAHIYPVENYFFGGGVTVAGLVTGGDIIKGLKGRPLGDKLLIPDVMLKRDGDVFLDNMCPDEVAKELGTRIVPVPVTGRALVDEVLS